MLLWIDSLYFEIGIPTGFHCCSLSQTFFNTFVIILFFTGNGVLSYELLMILLVIGSSTCLKKGICEYYSTLFSARLSSL